MSRNRSKYVKKCLTYIVTALNSVPLQYQVIVPGVTIKALHIMDHKTMYYVYDGTHKLHPTQYLFAAQLARECMITCGEGDTSMQIIGSDGKIYPNSGY